MKLKEELIRKLLEEVDRDIKDVMLREETIGDETYKGYQLLEDPVNSILHWQALRDRNK